MVHLRLLDLLFQYLLVKMACIDSGRVDTAVESVRMEYSAQCMLPSRPIGGAFLSDLIVPRMVLAIGVCLQSLVSFLMTGLDTRLNTPEYVAGCVVIYGYSEIPILPLHSR